MVYAIENGAQVVNTSWSCQPFCPENPLAEEVVRLARALGVVIVTSAGNARSPERKRGRKVAESAAEFAAIPAGPAEIAREISRLEGQMMEHARNLEFEQAARLRDRIGVLREQFVALS